MSYAIRPTARLRAFSLPLYCLWALLTLAVLPAFAQNNSPGSTVIDANARLHVTVANEAQLTGDYVVDSDGNITMLYINQVHVQGLTPAQAAAIIRGEPAGAARKATGLSQFYVNPQVVVSLVDAGGIGVDVTGLVTAPRHYVMRSNSRLNDVLQQAVPALNADLSKVEITRGDTKDKQVIDYRAYLDSKDETGNPVLHDGDVINVSSHDPLPISVNIQGQVGKPGRFQVPAGSAAYAALQGAGGPTITANLGGIIIKHFGATADQATPFKYKEASESPTDPAINPILLDGDTIIVPASPISSTYTLTGPGIRNPSEYVLPDGTPISLASAIGKAGGLTDRAKVNQISIIRTNPTTRATQTVKLDASSPSVQGSYLIQAGDNITIEQGSPPTHIEPLQLLGIAIAIFGIFHR